MTPQKASISTSACSLWAGYSTIQYLCSTQRAPLPQNLNTHKVEQMETVKQFLVRVHLANAEDRLQRLKDLETPTVLIKSQEAYIQHLRNGELKVGGDKDALEDEFIKAETKTGNGGKQYVVINDGAINYFPQAHYGPYIKRKEGTGI